MKNKTFTKILVVIMIASMAFSLCLFAGCKKEPSSEEPDENGSSTNPSDTPGGEDDNPGGITPEPEPEPDPDYFIGIIADPQVTPSVALNKLTNESYINYMNERQVVDMKHLSEAVYRSAIEEYLELKPDCVFIIGDLTDDRDLRAMQTIQEGCQQLKDAGIPVYTTMGINDIFGSATEFYTSTNSGRDKSRGVTNWESANFFAEFDGYMDDEPIAVHEPSYSYVADLPGGKFRLISFNSAASFVGYNHSISTHSKGYNVVEDEQIVWLENQLIQAGNDGKEVVMTTYFPFHKQVNFQCGGMPQDVFLTVDQADIIQPLLTKYGVKVVYNGHVQMEGDASYSDCSGSVQLVSSTSLATYPLPIKISKHVGKRFVSSITHLGSINAEYIPEYMSETDVQTLTTDAVAFAKQYLKDAFFNKWRHRSNIGDSELSVAVDMLNRLKLYDGSDQANSIVTKIEDWLVGVNQMNLYGDNNSVEKTCKGLHITIPKISGVTTVLDFMSEMSCAVFCGDMDMKPGSDNSLMFKYIMYVGIRKAAVAKLFTELHKLNNVVADCNLTNTAAKIFTTGKLDLASDDFIVSLLTLFVPLVQSKFPKFALQTTDSATLLKTLNTLLPIMLVALGDNYDKSAGTIWTVPYMELFDLTAGTINVSNLMDTLGPSLICANVIDRK